MKTLSILALLVALVASQSTSNDYPETKKIKDPMTEVSSNDFTPLTDIPESILLADQEQRREHASELESTTYDGTEKDNATNEDAKKDDKKDHKKDDKKPMALKDHGSEESKHANPKQADAKQSGESKQAEVVHENPVRSKQADENTVQSKQADVVNETPVQSKQANENPVHSKQANENPVHSKQADEHPSQYEEHPSQYEENPSQYGSENPSQYEENPSQYGSENPSQYEENPSQYGSENPSQYGNENPSQYGTENPSQHEGQHSSSGEKKSDALKGLNETGNEHSEETESSKKDPSKLQPDGPQDAASAHDTGSESPNMEPIEGTGNNSTSLNDSLLSESESSTLKYQLTGIAVIVALALFS